MMRRYTYLIICLLNCAYLSVYAQDGNVGVGVEIPQRKLHVFRGSAGPFASSTSTTAVFESDQNNFISLLNPESRSCGVLFGFPNSAASGGLIYNPSNSLKGLQFRTNGNISRMVIDSLGQVGIGTNEPSSMLEVSGSQPEVNLESNLSTGDPGTTNDISRINFRGHRNNLYRDAAYIEATQVGAWSANDIKWAPTFLKFYTQSAGNVDALTSPRMVISSSGHVGVGNDSPKNRLHITKGSAGTFTSSLSTTALFESDTVNYIRLINPAAYSSGFLFGNPSNIDAAGIIYNDNTNPYGLQFNTNGNDPSIYINNIGDVGINHIVHNVALSVKAKSSDVGLLRVMDDFGSPVLQALSNGACGINQTFSNTTLNVTGKSSHDLIFRVENSSGHSLIDIRNVGDGAIGGLPDPDTKLVIRNVEVFNEVLEVVDNSNEVIMRNSNDGTSDFFGQITKPLGSFKIDHPLDPENKYLYHSFVESPDMMNIYNGNIITDTEGRATVDLPDYFEALNMEFRYQLTVIGSFAQAIIQEEVRENQFVIATNEPNVKVSWQVTGIRHDPYANEYRIPNSIDKAPEEKGTYLYPEVYGKPATQSERYSKQEDRK